MITVSGSRITVDTFTQTAVFEGGRMSSLICKQNGERYLYDPDAASRPYPISAVYPMKRTSGLGVNEEVSLDIIQYSDTYVRIAYSGWFGHGELAIEEDCENGDICITPAVHSARPGLKACRYAWYGLREDLWVTVPYMQGVRMPLDEPILRTQNLQHLPYPANWEDNFVAFGNEEGGFSVYCRGARDRHKYLHLGAEDSDFAFSIDDENFGPYDTLCSAGGVTWRIRTYTGDWTTPVCAYRDEVLRAEPAWKKSEKTRPAWFDDIRMAVSWFPCDRDALDILRRHIDPKHVLIHIPRWRIYEYDQQYPDFTPSAEGQAFIEYGRSLGFHMAPHCNSLEIDPSIPEFELVRDFRYRDADTRDAFGWGLGKNGFLGVPEENQSIRSHRHYNVMTKIHPALPAWQTLLTKNVKAAVDALKVDTMFMDVTLCMWSITQGLVNNTSVMGGMEQLFDVLNHIGGVTYGGEGMNEMILFQHFAQGHTAFLDDASRSRIPVKYYAPVNHLLMGELCHLIAYHSGHNAETNTEQLQCDLRRGFLPCPFGLSDIDRPGSAANLALEAALSQR